MRNRRVSMLLLFLALGAGCLARAAEPASSGLRELVDLSSGWHFQIDAHDVGERDRWFDPGHDRSAWRAVEVPRAWDTYDESLRGFRRHRLVPLQCPSFLRGAQENSSD